MSFATAPEFRGTFRISPIPALISAATVVLTVACASPSQARDSELQRWTGGAQPAFVLPATDGAEVAVSAPRGGITLVHFFATWCESCREELASLNRLAERSGRMVKIVAVSIDDSDARVRRFFETTRVSYPVLLDRDRATAKAWKVTTLPSTFVLTSGLRPHLYVESDFAWDQIDPATLIDRTSARTANQNH